MDNYKSELYLSEVDPNVSCLGMKSRGKSIDDLPLAIAYVPIQKWNKTYNPEVGLTRGTIFPELDLPFLGEEVM